MATSALPLSPFLKILEREGFSISPRDYIRVGQVLEQVGLSVIDHPEEIKFYLAPLLAKSPEQQNRFYLLFDTYYRKVTDMDHFDAPADDDLDLDFSSHHTYKAQRLILIALAFILILGIGWWRLPNRQGPKIEPHPVLEVPPSARLSTGEALQFWNTSPNRSSYRFAWSFGDGTDTLFTSDSVLTHSYSRAGSYPVTLRLINAQGPDSLIQKIIRIAPACLPQLSIQVLSQNPLRMGDSLLIQNRSMSPNGQDRLSLHWDFGDGSPGQNTSDSVLRHAYQSPGQYTVQAESRGADSCKARFTLNVTVQKREEKVFLPVLALVWDKVPDKIYQTLPWLWLYLSLGILLLVILGQWLYFMYRSGYWLKKEKPNHERPYFLKLPNQDEKIALHADWQGLSLGLRQREKGERTFLDIPATIHSSIRAGGLAQLLYRSSSRPIEYLVLIDQKADTSTSARLFSFLVKNLVQEEVLIDYFYFDRDPARLWNEGRSEQLRLEDLSIRYPQHRLIVFSDGHAWINTQDAQLHGPTRERLSPWPVKALMTPVPSTRWGYEESRLYELFLLLPSSMEGQLLLVEYLKHPERPSLETLKENLGQIVLDSQNPEDLFPDFKNPEGLQKYLGETLYAWVCALALLPEPEWEMIIAIGKELETLPGFGFPEGQSLLSIGHLRMLARIPWLNEEQELPTALRRQLLQDLEKPVEQVASQAILEVLKHTHWQEEKQGSLARQKRKGLMLAQVARLKPNNPGIRRELKRLWRSKLLQDELLEEELSQKYDHLPPQAYWSSFIVIGLSTLLLWFSHGLDVNNPLSQYLQIDQRLKKWGLVLPEYSQKDSARIYNNRGVDAYNRLAPDSARIFLNKALRLDSGYQKPRENLARMEYNQGLDLYNQDYFEEAIPFFTQALQEPSPFVMDTISLSNDLKNPIISAQLINRSTLSINREIGDTTMILPNETLSRQVEVLNANQVLVRSLLRPLEPSWLAFQDSLNCDLLHALGLSYFFTGDTSTARFYANGIQNLLPGYFAPLKDDLLARLDNTAPVLLNYPEMVRVPGGTFNMGYASANVDERPVHPVSLSDFELSKQELSVGQYRAYLEDTEQTLPEAPDWGWQDELPMVNLSWYEAARYCNWLSVKQGYAPYYRLAAGEQVGYQSSANGYRLPSEAQWEFAARGGNLEKQAGYLYSGSNVPEEVAWIKANAGLRPQPLGQKAANALGFQDMTGNVWEWCEDHYAKYPSQLQKDPLKHTGVNRIIRGGSWNDKPANCRVSNRDNLPPENRYQTLGLRVARPLQPLGPPPPAPVSVPEVPPDLVWVPGGTFRMGSEDERDYRASPVHDVTLSNYYIGKTEVTVADFARFVEETAYQSTADLEGGSYVWTGSNYEKQAGVNWRCDAQGKPRPLAEYNHPVIHVSWLDAAHYCNWRSQKEGYAPYYLIDKENRVGYQSLSNGYRLPSEAQWEFAARGGPGGIAQNYIYSGGNGLDTLGWYEDNSSGQTQPVAQKAPNLLGLYDMSGNVWEWCDDWFASYSPEAQTNPIYLQGGDFRVLRGGSWDSFAPSCRVAVRELDDPDDRYSVIGFRLSRTP